VMMLYFQPDACAAAVCMPAASGRQWSEEQRAPAFTLSTVTSVVAVLLLRPLKVSVTADCAKKHTRKFTFSWVTLLCGPISTQGPQYTVCKANKSDIRSGTIEPHPVRPCWLLVIVSHDATLFRWC
jgi:hypothetical protein